METKEAYYDPFEFDVFTSEVWRIDKFGKVWCVLITQDIYKKTIHLFVCPNGLRPVCTPTIEFTQLENLWRTKAVFHFSAAD